MPNRHVGRLERAVWVERRLSQVQFVAGGDGLEVGMEMELAVDTLYRDDDCDYLVWKWRPVAAGSEDPEAERQGSSP